MRLIGSLPDQQTAERFADYLLTRGVVLMVEEGNSGWSVWVEDDDHVAQAHQELDEYSRNPGDPRYRSAVATADDLRRKQEKREHRLQKNYVDVRTSWFRPAQGRRPLTLILVALSCVVAAASLSVSRSPAAQEKFNNTINPLRITQIYPTSEGMIAFRPGLPEIRHGQVWRLVTPIFIHFDFWHLLFNMLWLYELGSLIEARKGTWLMLALVLVAAIPSNVLQYYYPIDTFTDFFRLGQLNYAPNSGGMSGVVYALFGYVWIKGRLQPHEGVGANETTVLIMLGWLVLCFTGLLGNIGNTAHAVGLLVGVIFAAVPYYWRRLRRA